MEEVLHDLKGVLMGARRDGGRWASDRAGRLLARTQELVHLMERLPEAKASMYCRQRCGQLLVGCACCPLSLVGPEDPPDEDAIPLPEAIKALQECRQQLQEVAS